MKKNEKLLYWQEKMNDADSVYEEERVKMDHREKLYRGAKELTAIVEDDDLKESEVVRNIVFELIEAQVDSTLPSPKVTALHEEDGKLAMLIEDFIRNKYDEAPSEVLNDQAERSVPMQGGGLMHIEWDALKRRSEREGFSTLSFVHPKQLSPQPGITSDIEDMDYCGISIGVTKSFIKKTFGIDVSMEEDEKPELRGTDIPKNSDMVTWRIIYFRNERGGIGRFSYVGDTVIEDFDDYQARRTRKCTKCGRMEPADWNLGTEPMEAPTLDGSYPGGGTWEEREGVYYSTDAKPVPNKERDGTCPYCGAGKFEDAEMEYEEVWQPFTIYDTEGEPILEIEGSHWEEDENGEMVEVPTKIPFYKPDIYPLILIKNISSWGKLLGESDIDRIEPQQNAINRLNHKIMVMLITGGSYISLPPDANIPFGTKDGIELRLQQPSDAQYLGVYTMQADISQCLTMMENLYQQARDIVGITDSFQGKEDNTATSGKAKEISAQQAAGRFAAKRVMKRYAHSRLMEALFKFELAYADDERPVIGYDENGMPKSEKFNRWLFLRKSEKTGEYYWDTDFLFSVDTKNALASDRTAMWQETRDNFLAGAFGDPTQTETQLLYWRIMDMLHYPEAELIKKHLVDKKEREAELMAEQAAMALQAQNAARAEAEYGGMT